MLSFIFLIFIFQAEACKKWLYWKLSFPWIRAKASGIIEADKEGGPFPNVSSLKTSFSSSNGINVKVYQLFLHLTAFITPCGPTPCSFKWALSTLAPHSPEILPFALSSQSLSQTPNLDQFFFFFSFFSPPSDCRIFPWAFNNPRLSRCWRVLEVLGGEWEGFICGKDMNCYGRMSENMAANSSLVYYRPLHSYFLVFMATPEA